MKDISEVPDNFTVDSLASAWLESKRLARLLRADSIMEKDPTKDSMLEVTQLMIEIKLLSSLQAEVTGGSLSRGAKLLGLSQVPVSDAELEEVAITRSKLMQSLRELQELTGISDDEIKLMMENVPPGITIVDDDKSGTQEENTKDHNLDWSFK